MIDPFRNTKHLSFQQKNRVQISHFLTAKCKYQRNYGISREKGLENQTAKEGFQREETS